MFSLQTEVLLNYYLFSSLLIRVLIKNFPYQPVENAVGESFVFLYSGEDTEYQTDEN